MDANGPSVDPVDPLDPQSSSLSPVDLVGQILAGTVLMCCVLYACSCVSFYRAMVVWQRWWDEERASANRTLADAS